MNDTLYISATAAFCFVLLSMHARHIFNDYDTWFDGFKSNYPEHQNRKAFSDAFIYIISLWAFMGLSFGCMIVFFAFWFKATQL